MTRSFRADIEGLRAISVIAVVLFHAFPTWVSGGFIGVDIFFVISGYLITRLLLGEIEETGRVDLLRFWGRRIRRILPAATLVLVSIAALIPFFPSLDARALGRHIVAAGLFFHNVRQGLDATDYLGASHDANPLLHYWSLSVEEQFYLVWPLTLAGMWILAKRIGGARRHIVPLVFIAALWLASFFYSVHLTSTAPAWAFFDPFSRSWQLLSGAFIAAAEPSLRQLRGWCGTALGVACLIAIGSSFVLISSQHPYPGITALVPTLAAALLIYANASQQTVSAAALATPALRYIGRISFSWYLWHWPLLVFGQLALGDRPVVLAAMIALSFLLATLTYRFVEQPVRRGALAMRPLGATYMLGASLIGLGVTSGVALRHLAPDVIHLGNGVTASAEAVRRDRPVIYADRCLLRFADVAYPACAYGAPSGGRTVVLFGDSHAANWFVPLDAAARGAGWRLLARMEASCRPVDAAQTVVEGGRERAYVECARWRDAVLQELKALKPDLIVVAGTRHDLPVDAERRVLAQLAAAGSTVVMRETPWFPENVVNCLSKTQDPARCAWPLVLSRNSYPRTANKDLPDGVRVLDLNSRICPDGKCRAVMDGRVVMFDSHHFTASFAETLSDAFEDALVTRGK